MASRITEIFLTKVHCLSPELELSLSILSILYHNLTSTVSSDKNNKAGMDLKLSHELFSLSAFEPSNLSASSGCILTWRGSRRLFLSDLVRTELSPEPCS